MQLEIAFNHFNSSSEISKTSSTLNVFPRAGVYSRLMNGFRNGQVVHLNGVAGITTKQNEEDMVFNLLDELSVESIDKISQKIEELKIFEEFEADFTINFAWEDSGLNRRFMQRANEIMESTDILIIIGYSFPNFNRSIDKKLMEPFKRGDGGKSSKVIYYQDPSAAEKIDLLKSQFNIPKVFPVTNKDEFFIPPNI